MKEVIKMDTISLESIQESILLAAHDKKNDLRQKNPGIEYDAGGYWAMIRNSRTGDLRSTKPASSGAAQYIWRWLRFHNGSDTCMPCTDDFGIWEDVKIEVCNEAGINPDGYLRYDHPVMQVIRNKVKAKKDRLDIVIEYILMDKYPLKQFRGAGRWAKAGLF